MKVSGVMCEKRVSTGIRYTKTVTRLVRLKGLYRVADEKTGVKAGGSRGEDLELLSGRMNKDRGTAHIRSFGDKRKYH